MRRGIKVRLAAFLILAAVGIVYVTANYLGVMDRVLGRGMTVALDLPTSGGTFVGSEVTYRGVKVGKVSAMRVTRGGVRLSLALQDGTKIPTDSAISVNNLTAVGEQYVNFSPPNATGPYATAGYVFTGDAGSLPTSTDTIVTDLDRFVHSVNGNDLSTVVSELGTMFRGNAENLGSLIDSGSRFVDQARAHQDQTISLLKSGSTVLKTQQAHKDDILAFSRGLAQLTETLKVSDPQLRTLLDQGPAGVREVDSLLRGLEPVLPGFLGNLVTVNQVVTDRLVALEQTLVTLVPVVSNGFTGTPGDGFGHLNMQFNYSTPACQKGYLPPPWPSAHDTRDLPLYPAKCADPKAQPSYKGSDAMNQRGVNMLPGLNASTGTAYRPAPYDASGGAPQVGAAQGGLVSVFGTDAWKWLLIGPVTASE